MTPARLRDLCQQAINNEQPDFVLVFLDAWDSIRPMPDHKVVYGRVNWKSISETPMATWCRLCRFEPRLTIAYLDLIEIRQALTNLIPKTYPKVDHGGKLTLPRKQKT